MLIGIVFAVLVNLTSTYLGVFRERSIGYDDADILIGQWEAFELDGKPMKRTSLTAISRQKKSKWWEPIRYSPTSHIRAVKGYHTDERGKEHHHEGEIALDRDIHWRATRTVFYKEDGATVEQRITIRRGKTRAYDVLFVTPDDGREVNAHLLKRKAPEFR